MSTKVRYRYDILTHVCASTGTRQELALASVGTAVIKVARAVIVDARGRSPATRAAAARSRRVDSILFVVLLAARLGSVQALYGCTESSQCKYPTCTTGAGTGACVSAPERALRRRVRSTQSDCAECGSAVCCMA